MVATRGDGGDVGGHLFDKGKSRVHYGPMTSLPVTMEIVCYSWEHTILCNEADIPYAYVPSKEFFTTKPYACELSSLPKYPPTKEMDAKMWDEEARRMRVAGKAIADGVKKSHPHEQVGRGIPVLETNAELQENIDETVTIEDGINSSWISFC